MSSQRNVTLLGSVLLFAAASGQPGCAAPESDEEETDSTVSSLSNAATFQEGVSPTGTYAGASDVTLLETSPTTNTGSDGTLTVDRDFQPGTKTSAVSLLAFNLETVPSKSKVQNVKLTLNVTNRTTGNGYSLYALKRSFTESQATWRSAASGVAWSSPGARGASDRDTVVLGTMLPTVTGAYTVTLNAAGVKVVQGWIDTPSSNHGFAFDDVTNADGLQFDSSQGATPTTRPKLAVTYDPPAPTQTVLLSSTFETATVAAPMLVGDYRTAMGDVNAAGTSNMVHTSVRSETGHGKYMRQTLPANQVGGGSGIVTFPVLAKVVDEAAIQYDVRFAGDFDWGWGGKLPGLGGALDGTSPGIASGCNAATGNAWSGRGMWITPGSYGSVKGENEWIGYMYDFAKTEACGNNIRTGKALSANQWHTVKQYYKMNSVAANGTPNADGVHRMWLDGVEVVHDTTFKYRNNPNLHINRIFWSVFRGGGTLDWATPTADSIDFDNILVTTPGI